MRTPALFHRFIALVAAATVFGLTITEADTALAQQPNILWIIADDLSPDLGAYGYDAVETPNIDRLASEGVRYTNAFATSPVCSAQRSSWITGMYPTTIGAQSHRLTSSTKQNLPAGIEPITEYFRDEGYYVTNANSGVTGGGKTDYNFLSGVSGGMYDGYDWANRAPGQPFFAQVQIFEPHRGFSTNTDPSRLADVTFPSYYPDHPVTRADWANYLVSVEELDRKVGVILDRLESEGLADDTVVMFFGDHGRPHARDKQWLYDGGLRVPMIVRGPGSEFTAGTVNDEMVSLVDIGVGSLGLTGATLPTHFQGEDIFDPAFTGRDAVFASRDRSGNVVDRVRSVQVGDLKLIRNFDPSVPYMKGSQESISYKRISYPVHTLLLELEEAGELTPDQAKFLANSRPEYELYDLSADPEELNNLAADPAYAAQLADLQGRLATWITQTDDAGMYPMDPTVEAGLVQNSINYGTNVLSGRGFSVNGDRTLELEWWEDRLGIEHQTLTSGQTLNLGLTQANDFPDNGGTLTDAPFNGNGSGASPSTGAVLVGNVQSTDATVEGLGQIIGKVTLEGTTVLRVGGDGIATDTTGATTGEDFESVAAGPAYTGGASTGLLPGWEYVDFPNTSGPNVDPVFKVMDTSSDPQWLANQRGNMLAQTVTDIGYAREGGGSSGEVIGGALAVAGAGSGIDSSDNVDIIEADFVWGDVLGDGSGQYLDTKIVFGYQDADNFLSLSVLKGQGSGTNTQVYIRSVVGGAVTDVFRAAGTSNFNSAFPDTDGATNGIFHAKLIHDATSGFVFFELLDGDNPSTVYATATVSDSLLTTDGLVGFGTSNDAGAWDNLSVTTQAALPAIGVQVLEVVGNFDLGSAAMIEMDLLSASVFDQLKVTGDADLAGGLSISVSDPSSLSPGDSFKILDVGGTLSGTFDGLPEGALVGIFGDARLFITYQGGDGNDIELFNALAGDLDGDGFVGLSDLDLILNNWNQSIPPGNPLADPTGDGFVGLADLDIVLNNWNAGTPPNANTNIPEPVSVALFGVCGMLYLQRRGR